MHDEKLCGQPYGGTDIECQKRPDHGIEKHHATGRTEDGGSWVLEWEDAATIRRLLGIER